MEETRAASRVFPVSPAYDCRRSPSGWGARSSALQVAKVALHGESLEALLEKDRMDGEEKEEREIDPGEVTLPRSSLSLLETPSPRRREEARRGGRGGAAVPFDVALHAAVVVGRSMDRLFFFTSLVWDLPGIDMLVLEARIRGSRHACPPNVRSFLFFVSVSSFSSPSGDRKEKEEVIVSSVGLPMRILLLPRPSSSS